MTEREAYIAFNLTENIGSAGVAKLVSSSGSVAAAWETYPKKIARSGGAVNLPAELELAQKYGVQIVTPADADYPDRLRSVPGHPLALYVKGDPKALSHPSLAIVGTRRATSYGKDQAYRFGRDIAAAGWSIVSGLALGIDSEAHRGALDAGGVTIGIIGSGLDRFYPEENRTLAREIAAKRGAVVSEFPFGRSPDTQTFPQRNRIVAALATGVLAIESPAKSGTLITVGFAADLGRSVMALPGRVDSRSSAGCLNLIRDGARLVRCPADVIEELSDLFTSGGEFHVATKPVAGKSAVSDKASETPSLSPMPPFSIEESLVMKHVDCEGVTLDRLVDLTGLDAGRIGSVVMTLRLKGRLRFLPGNRVATPRE